MEPNRCSTWSLSRMGIGPCANSVRGFMYDSMTIFSEVKKAASDFKRFSTTEYAFLAALETPSSRGGRGGGRRMEPQYLGPLGITTVCSVVWGEPRGGVSLGKVTYGTLYVHTLVVQCWVCTLMNKQFIALQCKWMPTQSERNFKACCSPRSNSEHSACYSHAHSKDST